jgi:hypothetical protein
MDYWVEPLDHPKDGGFYGVAHCGDIDWPGYREKQFEWEANAFLIAAAPDLLRTVKRLIDEFVDPQQGDEQFDSAITRKAVELARAAIAKAEGAA